MTPKLQFGLMTLLSVSLAVQWVGKYLMFGEISAVFKMDEVNATDTVALTHVVKATDTINPD